MSHILIATNELGQETFYGPFEDGEQALNWGLENITKDNTLSAVFLNEPKN